MASKLNFKEYFKISAIYTVVGMIAPVLQLVVQPLIEGEHRLNAVDFSHLAILETVISLVFNLSLHSISYSLFRLYFDYKDQPALYQRFVSTSFISVIVRGAVLFFIVLLFGKYIGGLFHQSALQQIHTYIHYAIVSGVARAVINAAGVLYRNERKVWDYVWINIGLAVLRSGFQVIGVFYWDMSFIGYVQGTAVGSGIVMLLFLWKIFRGNGVKLDFSILRTINKFGRPLFIVNLLYWGVTFIDRFFMEGMPVDLGVYDNAMKFALGVQLIVQALFQAGQPEIMRYMTEGLKDNIDKIRSLSNMLMIQSQLMIVFMIIPVIIFIRLFYQTDLCQSAELVPLIFVKFIFYAQVSVFSMSFYFHKKTKVILYIICLVLAVSVISNYMLIPLYKSYGAIASSYISMFIHAALMYVFVLKNNFGYWNDKKVVYFPFVTIILCLFIELLKNYYQLDVLVSVLILNILVCLGVILLYQRELKQLLEKYGLMSYNK